MNRESKFIAESIIFLRCSASIEIGRGLRWDGRRATEGVPGRSGRTFREGETGYSGDT
jgi:hypothetical protein